MTQLDLFSTPRTNQPFAVGDIVTYDVDDETQTLHDIKPFPPFLKESRLVIGEYEDELQLYWEFGQNYKCRNVATLDAKSATVLKVIGKI